MKTATMATTTMTVDGGQQRNDSNSGAVVLRFGHDSSSFYLLDSLRLRAETP